MTIHCTSGSVWLTHAGEHDDFFVPAGTRYCSAHGGRIVMSAVDGPCEIAVRWRPPRGHPDFVRCGVGIDSSEAIRATARRLRSRYIGEFLERLARTLLRHVRRRYLLLP
jgi:hypothetical protein